MTSAIIKFSHNLKYAERGNVIATGDVMGAANNLTGNSYVMVDGAGANGRSMMEANGGGDSI